MTTRHPAARLVAPSVVEHLASHRASARARGFVAFAPEPDAAVVERLADAAFWASLRREEGREPRISIAWLPPDTARQSMVFSRSIPLEPRALVKLAPAVERPGVHLGVWPSADGALHVWGTARTVPTLTFVLEVVAPGLLVLKYRRGDELDKFGTIAVLEGDAAQVVDEAGASLPDCPDLLANLLGFETPALSVGTNVLVQLAISMRAHGRGGTLVVVPEGQDAWCASTVQPTAYQVQPYEELPALLATQERDRHDSRWRDALRRTVEALAGLTAVDGATVIDASHRLLAFGVKLVRQPGAEQIASIGLTAPVVGNRAAILDPSALGGTRHLSAAQFIHEQRDALAMVASQDGRFTVMAWSPCEGRVHAHRVEMLLM